MDTKSFSLSGASERKGHKRKLADTSLGLSAAEGSNNSLTLDVRAQVDILKSCISWKETDRVAARSAAHALAELAKHGEILYFLCIFCSQFVLSVYQIVDPFWSIAVGFSSMMVMKPSRTSIGLCTI
jgi:hypothetical protein